MDILTVILLIILVLILLFLHGLIKYGNQYRANLRLRIKDLRIILNIIKDANPGAFISIRGQSFYEVIVRKKQNDIYWWLEVIVSKHHKQIVDWCINKLKVHELYFESTEKIKGKEKFVYYLGYDVEEIHEVLSNIFYRAFENDKISATFCNTYLAKELEITSIKKQVGIGN